MQRTLLAALVLAALGAPAFASVNIKDPWVRATASYQKSSVVFMQLTSSNDARLVKADSPLARKVEIHQMVKKNAMMKMQTVPSIALPAGKTVELKPDGYMVMLMGLKQQIKEGDSIPVSIVIEGKNKKRETVRLNATAMTMDSRASAQPDHEHMHDHAAMHDHEHMHD